MPSAREVERTDRAAVFGVPSLKVAERIADSDATHHIHAATFRYNTRMRELETQFEAKASEIRAAFVAEVANAGG